MYCSCGELVVGNASMGKQPDLDTFDCRQIIGVQHMGHSISEIVTQLGFSRFEEYTKNTWMVYKKLANCKGQLALTVHCERWLRCIVCVASEPKH
ncbi:hypothetical protein TNCV_1582591 [Trichonephila clavipes]|nr:hypothetical protein TNCV_1582591 [Trichonephila clavipes]